MSPPTPIAFVLLVLLLPGVWLAGSALAGRVTSDRVLARLLTPAIAVAAWLFAIHAVSLVARSFWIGLPAGTLLVSACGVRAWLSSTSPPVVRGHEASDVSTSRWTWITALVVTAYLAPAAFGWALHDEIGLNGHLSFTAQIENGIYPPRHLSFPELELVYHYGFDLFVAAVASMLRLRADHAIDLVTLAAWGYSWCLAWVTGERLVGRSWGGWAAAVMLFGGGIPFFAGPPLFASPQTLVMRLLSMGAVGPDDLNPPIVSYFFQHPWTLGIPLALAIVLVVSTRDVAAPWARSAALSILLVALSFCQTVLFVCLVGALLIAEPLTGGAITWRRVRKALGLLGGVVVVASCLHGFFTPPPDGAEGVLEFRLLSLGGSRSGWASWHLQTFGLLLPLGIIGIALLTRERLLVALLVAESFLVLNVVRYRFSWDVVKFATVAALALSLGASASLRRLFELRWQPLGRAAGAVALVGLVAAGLVFPIVVGFHRSGVPFSENPAPLSAADEPVVDWLRRHVRAGEIVRRNGPTALAYTQWGGLPQLGYDHGAFQFGLPRHLLDERTRFVAAGVSRPEELLRQRVRWLVLEGDDDPMAPLVERWVRQQRALVRARFGSLRIVEVLGAI